MLQNAGAIILGVSNLPGLCLSYETYNKTYGRTLNPYHTGRSAGGSSGGEAALLGAGASLVGIGSDVLGSIRLPSAFCGVFGLRTTSSIVPIEGAFFDLTENSPLRKLFSFGPMVRYAKDLPLMLKIMAGSNVHHLNLDKTVDFKELKVFFKTDFEKSVEFIKIDSEVRQGLEESLEELKRNGSDVAPMPKEIDMDRLLDKLLSMLYNTPREEIIKLSEISRKPNDSLGILGEILKFPLGLSDHTLINLGIELIIRCEWIGHKDEIKHFSKMATKLQTQIEVGVIVII